MTIKKISWLHLSDLHIGDKTQGLWPNFKSIFKEDLRRLADEAGPIDLLLFSGDLTQSGSKDEYVTLTNELCEIFEELDKLNQHPVFFSVPGNHDLVRPPENSACMKMLTRWKNDPEVMSEFWQVKNNQYINLVEGAFSNYMDWQNEIERQGIKLAPQLKGLLPGDASSSLELNGITVGLLGLNTSFLQLSGGDFNGNLRLDYRQLNAITENDSTSWCNKHDINFLITHHPVSWLSDEAQKEFKTEIYPSGRFTAHLYGHMHEAELSTQYQAGDAGRKSFQSSSLFGMEHLSDNKTKRVHGYSVGQILFEENEVYWKLWPRKGSVNRSSRNRRIVPDHENFELKPGHEYLLEQLIKSGTSSSSVVIADPRPFDLSAAVEENAPQWNNALNSSLHQLAEQVQHLSIRPLERQACIEIIRQEKIAWVCADWRLGRDGFLWTVISRMERDMQPVYRISLENYSTREDFLLHFETLMGCSFAEFCKALAIAGPAFLLLDEVPISPGDNVGSAIERDVENLAIMIRDFCPEIVVLLLARTEPRDHKIDFVKLEALDEVDTRTYLIAHPEADSALKTAQAVSKIYRRTDGVPGKIDSTLKTLRVVSLSELEPANLIESSSIVSKNEFIPMSLVKTVAELSESNDAISKRSYLLLKVLAILPNGESLARLKHIDHKNPIFPKNAEELLDNDLIQVRTSTLLIGLHGSNEERIKILYAPSPVRDYVLSQMSNREIDSLVLKATSLYFGEKWRTGKAALQKLGGELTSDDGGLMDNPHTIVMRLLKNSSAWEAGGNAIAILNLCQIYCNALFSAKHYRNCATVCRDILSITPEVGYESHCNAIKALFARSLRMTGDYDEAKLLLDELLAIKQSKSDEGHLLLIYALCLQSSGDSEAIVFANKVIDLVPKSSHALHAQSIIIEMNHDVDSGGKLLALENKARKLGHDMVANNLVLKRADNDDDYSSLRLVHSTALKDGDTYNAARAVVKLGELSIKESGTLSNTDLKNLINAYQYFYGERFSSLFTKSHEALWDYFNSQSDTRNLLSLFRHSSFIWRLHGDEAKEKSYIQELSDTARSILTTDILTADTNTAYFLTRARNEKIKSFD